MANRALKVLHVEDDFADAMLVQHAVCEAGDLDIAFEVARTLRDAKRLLGRNDYDLVLLDLRAQPCCRAVGPRRGGRFWGTHRNHSIAAQCLMGLGCVLSSVVRLDWLRSPRQVSGPLCSKGSDAG